MNNFFGMLARMRYINRWGLMRNTIQENIAEHSLDVAVISHALATIGNIYFNKQNDAEHIAVLAMFHDTSEIITGDLPTPIKYYAPEIRDSYKKVEEVATNQLINELPEEMRKVYRTILKEEQNEDWKYVKAADRLSAYIKCIEESKMGNTDFVNAQNSIKKSIDEMKMPEIAFFIEKFLLQSESQSIHVFVLYHVLLLPEPPVCIYILLLFLSQCKHISSLHLLCSKDLLQY